MDAGADPCSVGVVFSPHIILAGQTVMLCGPDLSVDAVVTFEPYSEGRPVVSAAPPTPGAAEGLFEVVVDTPEPDASHTFYRVVVTTVAGSRTAEAWLEVRPTTVPVETTVSFFEPAFEPREAFASGSTVNLSGARFDPAELNLALVAWDSGEVRSLATWTVVSLHTIEVVMDLPDAPTSTYYRIRLTQADEVAMTRAWLQVHPRP